MSDNGLDVYTSFILQYSPYGFFAVNVEDLVEVVGNIVGGDGAVTHHEVVWFLLRYGGDYSLVDVLVEASHQVAILHHKYLLAVYLSYLNLARQRQVAFR